MTLTGVERPAGQTAGVTAVGEVVPRSAPPGDDARALGRVGVTTPVPAPSGTFIQARVSERFDLIDQTQVVTQPFTQDLRKLRRATSGRWRRARRSVSHHSVAQLHDSGVDDRRGTAGRHALCRRRYGIGARTGRRSRRQCGRRRVAGSGRGACRQRSGHAAPRDRGRRRHRRARRFRSDCGPTDRHGRRQLHGRRRIVDVGHRRPHDPGSDSRRARIQRPIRPATSQGRRRR